MAAELLGAHMPTGKGLGDALRSGKAIGCSAVQVFTSSPQQWRAKEISSAMVLDFKEAQRETGIESVVSHDSYLINLSSGDEELREKSVHGLIGELNRCAVYGIPNVVSHMGSWKGLASEDEGCRRIAESTLRVLNETSDDVTLLMETTAGQGTSLGYRFEQLARVLELTEAHPRLGICLDTCHVFAAGYDIRKEENYEVTWAGFDAIIGLDRLRAIHCNDSKKPFGSRVDRHEHIAEGEIGPTAFRLLVNDRRFTRIPILLETPDAPEGHQMNLDRLRSYQV
jgi:deoxyribonuclease-4